MNILGLAVAGVLCCGVGIVAFAYYAKQGCDPLKAGKIRNANQVRVICSCWGNEVTILPIYI